MTTNTPLEASATGDESAASSYFPGKNPLTQSERPHRLARATLRDSEEPKSRGPASPYSTPKPKGRDFNDLPPEIVQKIWQYIAETPSFLHVRIYPQGIHVVTPRINQEHLVNTTWYFAPELRKSLCRSTPQERLRYFAGRISTTSAEFPDHERGYLVQKAEDVARLIRKWHPKLGRKPFIIEYEEGERSLPVRPDIDWFYLENYAGEFTTMAGEQNLFFRNLSRASTIVLRLEDVYKNMCGWLNQYDLKPTEPWRVDHRNSREYVRKMASIFGMIVGENFKLEQCLILVGDLEPGVQPFQMRLISVAWAGPEGPSITTQREIVTSPEVSLRNRTMIRLVHQEIEYFGRLQRQRRNDWLRSAAGQGWLACFVHHKDSWHSRWLASTEGSLWRETAEGQAWLQTPSGYWWLASTFGSPWLETQKGLEWLDSEAGFEFLTLPAARVWAGIDNNGNANSEGERELPNKKWFSTPKGRLWVAHNCPDRLVPIAPQPPLFADGENTIGDDVLPEWFHIHAPKFGFMMPPPPPAEPGIMANIYDQLA